MGGCCCHASRTLPDGAPMYSYASVQNRRLPSSHSTPVVLVIPSDPNLNNSACDACQEHNSISAHGGLTCEQTNIGSIESHRKNEHAQPADSLAVGDAAGGSLLESSDACDGLKKPRNAGVSDSFSISPRVKEDVSNLCSSMILVPDAEDVCPICLDEYDAENPQIVTQCKHHFHLSCILDWLERSNTCAICDKVMKIDGMAL